jgi:transcriptional regulator with XRE-family HTH domain
MRLDGHLAALLRSVRRARHLSQLELSLRLGVSQRHVGFIENGRAHPSRPLLVAWIREAGGSLSLCNMALLLAGYAPTPGLGPSETPFAGAEALLQRTIDLHHPSPGLVFNRDWTIVRMNASARRLCERLMPEVFEDHRPLDMLAALAHPRGWLSLARQPAEIAAALLGQLRVEQWVHPSLTPRIDALEAALKQRYGPLDGFGIRDPASTGLNIVLDTPMGTLSFSAIQSFVGLPQDAACLPWRTELWFPADEGTIDVLHALDGENATAGHGDTPRDTRSRTRALRNEALPAPPSP